MSHQHDKWLDWKIRNGLANRGPTGRGTWAPKSFFGGLLYKVWFKRYDKTSPLPPKDTFTQDVRGCVKMKGDLK